MSSLLFFFEMFSTLHLRMHGRPCRNEEEGPDCFYSHLIYSHLISTEAQQSLGESVADLEEPGECKMLLNDSQSFQTTFYSLVLPGMYHGVVDSSSVGYYAMLYM